MVIFFAGYRVQTPYRLKSSSGSRRADLLAVIHKMPDESAIERLMERMVGEQFFRTLA